MIEQILKTTRKYLQAFLSNYLPQISNDWWQHCVINELSFQQKQTILKNNYKSLHNLDLAMLLVVLKKNYNFISIKANLNQNTLNLISNVIDIRNKYAHLNDDIIDEDDLSYDLQTIKRFFKSLGFDISMIEEAQKNKTKEIEIEVENLTQTGIIITKFQAGDLICLKADKTKQGVIMEIIPQEPEIKYKVFIENNIREYFESQIELNELKPNVIDKISKNRINAFITSDLILNPNFHSLYSLNSGNIDFIPYQYRPVIKLINSDKPRILIADEVGLGKTIEAGLILKELQVREDIKSILVICPKPLIVEHKWYKELKKFDEEFEEVDSAKLKFIISEFDKNGALSNKYSKVIIPYSIFDEELLKGGKNKKGLLQLDSPLQFDLVIVDEAHRIRNRNTIGYKVVEYFCQNANSVALLSATPIQNSDKDLFTLLNLLRPDLIREYDSFQSISEPNSYINNIIELIRIDYISLKEHIITLFKAIQTTKWFTIYNPNNPNLKIIENYFKKDTLTTKEKVELLNHLENLHTLSNIISRTRRKDIGEFTIRNPQTIEVKFTETQEKLYNKIIQFISNVLSAKHKNVNVKFMTSTILRQTSSSLFGLLPFIETMLEKHYDGLEFEYFDEYENTNLENFDFKNELEEIKEMLVDIDLHDPKAERLIEVIKDKNKLDNKKIIIFSSFRHTINYLSQKLTENNIRFEVIHGDVKSDDRLDIKERFGYENEEKNTFEVLLSTEVGSEGLDFQFSDCLINYDLPWNPMRIEQRIGRIDRYGQKSEKILIYNFVTPGTIDYDIYDKCLTKIGIFKSAIGGCEEILGTLTKEINEIAIDFKLSDIERKKKLEKLTENKEREIIENEKLESEQVKLFSVQIPDEYLKKEIENYTNKWLTADSIENLIRLYLNDKFNKDAIQGESEIKNLRLSKDDKSILLSDIKSLNTKKLTNDKFEKWLKSEEINLAVSFNSQIQKNNKKIHIISPTHNLVKLASKYYENVKQLSVKLYIATNEFPTGLYSFAIFKWHKVGLKEINEYKVISENDNINKNIYEIIQNTNLIEQKNIDNNIKNQIENLHYQMWENARKMHIENEIVNINTNISIISNNLDMQINNRTEELNQSREERIIKMKKAQIHNLENTKASKLKELNDKKSKIDIYAETIIIGIIENKGI